VNSDCGQDEIITAMEKNQDRDRAGSKE
jgi:hypothetical protein